jgi:hypothetical protein
MAALAQDRNTPRLEGDLRRGGLAASVLVYAGAIVMRNAAGYLTKGATATGLVGVGRSEERATGGAAAGDANLRYRPGTYRYGNSAAADLIGITEIGKVCYAVDDQTVAKTDGTGARSPAGFVEDIDAQGVWVRFDEVALQSHLAGLANPA